MDRGTVRLLIVVALAVVGGFVLANGFDGDVATGAIGSSPTPTTSPTGSPTDGGTTSPTEPPTDRPQPQPPEEIEFVALNSTNLTGAGAAAQEKMVSAGYVVAEDAADSPVQGALTTTILYRGGEDEAQNRVDAKQVVKDVFPGSQTAELNQEYDDIVPGSATIVVLVGEDWAEKLTTT